MMRKFVSLGMFIVDEFRYLDDNGNPITTGVIQEEQVSLYTPVETHAV